MKYPGLGFCTAFLTAAVAVLLATPALAQTGQGHTVVTVLPKHEGEVPTNVLNPDISIKINGRQSRVTKWTPYQGSASSVELVILIDSSARSSLGRQMEDMTSFIRSLPPSTKAAIAYMQNGSATFAAPLSADHGQVLSQLHLPGGSIGSSASPYFCLSDLAKRWPSQDPQARRVVVMVTDGVDNYERQYNPEDPYVQTAIEDSVRAHLAVYPIYWLNQGRADSTMYENNAGQNLLSQVAESTGGKSFWLGMGNPVSFQPYFDELTRRLRNQYELRFVTQLDGKPEVETLKLKFSAPGSQIDSPERVFVVPAAPAQD